MSKRKKIIRNPKKFDGVRPEGVKDKPQATDTQHGKKNNENRKQNCVDWSIIAGEPRKVKVKGRIDTIFDDLTVANCTPLSNYYTVTLYPRKGKVFYLKFKTKEELERQTFTVDETVVVEGILRCVDGKQIVTNVKRSSEEF